MINFEENLSRQASPSNRVYSSKVNIRLQRKITRDFITLEATVNKGNSCYGHSTQSHTGLGSPKGHTGPHTEMTDNSGAVAASSSVTRKVFTDVYDVILHEVSAL